MVFVADADGVSFGFEILVFELNDETLHLLHQLFVAYAVTMFLHGKVLPVLIGNRAYDCQVVGGDIPRVLSIPDTDDTLAFRFVRIDFVL